MAFAREAPIPKKPDLAVIGIVEKVEPFKKSQDPDSVYWSAEVSLKALTDAGRDASFWIVVVSQFFTNDFDPEPLSKAEPKTLESSLYNVHLSHLARTQKDGNGTRVPVAHLPVLAGAGLAGGGWEAICEFSNRFSLASPPTYEDIHRVVSAALMRKGPDGSPAKVGYVLRQQKDDDGELNNRYAVQYFFDATEDGVKAVAKSATSKRRKTPLVLTWPSEW